MTDEIASPVDLDSLYDTDREMAKGGTSDELGVVIERPPNEEQKFNDEMDADMAAIKKGDITPELVKKYGQKAIDALRASSTDF